MTDRNAFRPTKKLRVKQELTFHRLVMMMLMARGLQEIGSIPESYGWKWPKLADGPEFHVRFQSK